MKRPEALPSHSWWTLFQRPHCHLAAVASSWFHLILKHSTCYVGKSSPDWGWRTVRIAWFVNSLSVKSWCRELFIIYWKIKGTPPTHTHTTITVLFPELSGLSPASNMKQKKKLLGSVAFVILPFLQVSLGLLSRSRVRRQALCRPLPSWPLVGLDCRVHHGPLASYHW